MKRPTFRFLCHNGLGRKLREGQPADLNRSPCGRLHLNIQTARRCCDRRENSGYRGLAHHPERIRKTDDGWVHDPRWLPGATPS